ncbi:MAG: DUF72 domain-containing protein [Pseudomonadota bacterium]|nr:DUF72 domain-containing protein [Pseudomonadota bacterium]
MTELRIGTSGWHYGSWRGLFYPPELRPKDFLAFYVRRFASTEINASFYRLPAAETVAAWRDAVPNDFVFAWKASRFITHFKRLKDVGDSLALVFGRMSALGPKSGPVLFQLPPTMRADCERLAAFLQALPEGWRYALEFRHPSWYDPAIFDLLRDFDVSLCLSDHAAAPAPMVVTAGHVYLRPHGPGGRYAGNYGDETLRDWAGRIAAWQAESRSVYCYFDNDQKSAAPQDAERLMALL